MPVKHLFFANLLAMGCAAAPSYLLTPVSHAYQPTGQQAAAPQPGVLQPFPASPPAASPATTGPATSGPAASAPAGAPSGNPGSAPAGSSNPPGRPPAAPATSLTPAAPGEPVTTRQFMFAIPFTVQPTQNPADQPVEVRLFVSGNRGTNWDLYSRQAPTSQRFDFRAGRDGEYWFCVRTVDRQGKLKPNGPNTPELKVIVDTTPPRLDMLAQIGPSGEIRASWRVEEPHLLGDTFKLSYQPKPGGPWLPVAANLATGVIAWQPDMEEGPALVRAEIRDRAGNPAIVQRTVNVPKMANRPRATNVAAQRPPFTPTTLPPRPDGLRQDGYGGTNSPASPSAPSSSVADLNTGWQPRDPATRPISPYPSPAGPAPAGPSPIGPAPAPIASHPPTNAPVGPPASYPPTHPASADPFAARGRDPQASNSNPTNTASTNQRWPSDQAARGPLVADRGPSAHPSAAHPSSPAYRPDPYTPDARYQDPRYQPVTSPTQPPVTSQARPISSSNNYPSTAPSSSGLSNAGTGNIDLSLLPAGATPRMSRWRRFNLEYDIQSAGPTGVAKVELWGTRDGGRTWSRYGVDADRASPFPVEVEGEGMYGFTIVIENRSGLSTRVPLPGDPAEVWIGVDLSLPKGQFIGVKYGEAERLGELDISWQAADIRLAEKPITILISDKPGGPWHPVIRDLPNTGHYTWRPDRNTPRNIYFRLEVRDDAGNVGVHELAEPISADGLAPKGTIRGISPADENAR